MKYAHNIAQLHYNAGHYIEAGHSILLHAEQLLWDSGMQVPKITFRDLVLPEGTHRDRKETLYKMAIEYFAKGKCWEKASDLIRELAQVSVYNDNYNGPDFFQIYGEEMWDFQGIADLLVLILMFFSINVPEICTEKRSRDVQEYLKDGAAVCLLLQSWFLRTRLSRGP